MGEIHMYKNFHGEWIVEAEDTIVRFDDPHEAAKWLQFLKVVQAK